MPRYEFSEGTSNKFWQIDLAGQALTTTWGKIGTRGQFTTKTFDTPAKAKSEYDKLVAEKVKKGYLFVGEVTSGPPPTATAKSKPAAPPPAKAVPPPEPPPPVVPPPPPVPSGAPFVIVDAELKATAARARKAAKLDESVPPDAIIARLKQRLDKGKGGPFTAAQLYLLPIEILAAYFDVISSDEAHAIVGSGYRVDTDAFAPFVEQHEVAAVLPLVKLLALFVRDATPEWKFLWNYSGATGVARAIRGVRNSPEAVAGAVAALSAFASVKLGKEMDPGPALMQILRGSPCLALPLVRIAAKEKGGSWAKDLAPQLERLLGGADLVEAAPAEVPKPLREAAAWKAPAWWSPAAIARPQTLAAKVLPLSALDALAARLKDAVDDPTDNLDEIKDACTRESLADFGWDLFNTWLSSGAPVKDKWAFAALGVLGTDQTARRLTPLIRGWPGESQHQRAVAGLDVLGRIGTDVAMMMLNGIAEKVKFKGLQERARQKMDEIAEKRGLTAEELADRLVPDLDLEDDGSMTLDFGPRSFRVGFDEALTPYVMDATGARVKELPKPNSKDDATLAGAATKAWKAMKKDARTLSSLQVLRMELGMGNARRWAPTEFEAFLVQHPLLIHLVRRVVWGVWKNNELTSAFRVAEDRTYADANDDAFEIPAGVLVGIVHRYHLGDTDAAKWGKVFGDYELLQPFEQLGRQVYPLTDAEKKGNALDRFDGRIVDSKKILGLGSRGWRRGEAQDAGCIFDYYKPIGKDLFAILDFANGLNAGGMDYVDPTQTLGKVSFGRSKPGWSFQSSPGVAIESIDPVIVSEVIRDVEALGTTEGK